MSDVWMQHVSVELWRSPSLWVTYFSQAQDLIGARLTHFDATDPIKRKVSTLDEAGEYACAFEPNHDSRWLFGRFAETGVWFSARHMRQIESRKWHNEFIWHLPASFVDDDSDRLRLLNLFDAGNALLRPFYSFCDERGVISAMSRQKSPGRKLDIERELLGIYWLTYFNSRYVEFFGEANFQNLPSATFDERGGVTLSLCKRPGAEVGEQGRALVERLGSESFFDPEDWRPKPLGEHALTLDQLLG